MSELATGIHHWQVLQVYTFQNERFFLVLRKFSVLRNSAYQVYTCCGISLLKFYLRKAGS